MTTLNTPNGNTTILTSSRNRYLHILVLLLMFASGMGFLSVVSASLTTPQSPVLIIFIFATFIANLFAYVLFRYQRFNVVIGIVMAEVVLGLFATAQAAFW